jgi:hypothetical protein
VAQRAKSARGWFSKLLSPDPPEPRKAEREAMPGLSAYFFTGGESVAHGVRDISRTGFYIFTGERWYPGTILRMTLTERGRGGVERSITVNATAVRWGNDGVGLNFVFQDAKDLRRGVNPQMDGMLGGATKAQVAEFLKDLKSGSK